MSSASGQRRTAEQAGARQSVSAVRPSSVVALGERAAPAVSLWPEVIETVEARWRDRHGTALSSALKAASSIADRAGVLMPAIVPVASGHRIGSGDWRELPAGKLEHPDHARVLVLLSRALMAVKIAYEELSRLPLVITANTLRVIEEEGTPLAQLHLRSGNPPETAASQCTVLTKQLRWAALMSDSARRGRIVRLTPAGKEAQAAHCGVVADVEASVDADGEAVAALTRLLGGRRNGDLAIRDALTPPPRSRRFSTEWVTGRPVDDRDHQVVAQTQAFRSHPFTTLPHYPVWEATRGFRP